jgi:hypothetical protein
MSATTSSGKCSAPARSRTVVCGCAPESTTGARSSSPSSSVTPVTAPPALTSIEATGALVRTVAPWAHAARASARLIAPIPPRTWPQAPGRPSSEPSPWCSRLYAVPGVRGPAHTPTTPVEARQPLSASSSNHSSSRSPTDIVISRNSSRTRAPGMPAVRAAHATTPARSAGRRDPSAGGGRSSSGRTKDAARSSSSMNAGYASASRRERRAIDARARAGSSWKNTGAPPENVA